MPAKWDDSRFRKNTVNRGMDGLEEWGRVEALPQMKTDCPVKEGVMRDSLDLERDDRNLCIYLGGGGAAKAYILRQERDKSLDHPVGKAGFIEDSIEMKAPKIKQYVEKRL